MFGAIAGGIASALAGGARSESGSAGMPRPISYAVFCLKKKMGEVPSAARADVHPLDGHLVFSRPHPLSKELRICICPEHGVTGRVESALHSDFRIVWCCD